ncbi:hypothetical protein OIU83_21555 [Flavobacterium sp. LS1R49]|uniref:MORN repeat variant n=1 Tax=Flavobacterium shii TaxID=2987687 RepID=A0A9X2YXT1_9FLAO|nr:hypothetical protein [Flavobacterium shii]MCV9930259.1 hypothetical protein [Flavobacterium shii]
MNKKHILIIVTILIMMSVGYIFFYCTNETIYTLKDYNIKTGATDVSEYIIRKGDTIFEGKFTRYNEKGIKIAEGQFIDNEPNGICSYYYDNGKIKSVHFRKNSKINLESTFYDTSGLINKYVVYDYLGNHFFIIYFDEKGATKYDGYFQIETYQYKFSHKNQFNIKHEEHLEVGDVLKYSYIIANIPNTKRSFKIENLSVDNSIVKRTLKHIEPCQLDVEEILTKKGKNTIRSIVQYKFNDKVTPVFNDTLSFDVNVH